MQIELNKISRTFADGRRVVKAVQEADLTIGSGEILGLLGPSGSGKSTLGQIAAGLLPPSSGKVLADGVPISLPLRGQLRRKIQLLYQHPENAFNPRRTILFSLKETCSLCRFPSDRRFLLAYLARFGIYNEHLDRYPGELSGGELQRLALARILMLSPELIVLDEPTSMLDSISQAQMIRLLKEINREEHTAYLFISHDEALTRLFCSRVMHMDAGILRADPE